MTLAETQRAPGDAGGPSITIDGYGRRLFVVSQSLATTATSSLFTPTRTPRAVSVAVSILAEASSSSFWKAALSGTLARKSSRTSGAMFSAGCVCLSSVSWTNPNWAMAGCVEQSSARSIVLAWRAWAIGASHAASLVRDFGGYVIP